MYSIDVEDIEDEDKDEKRNEKAAEKTGRDLQSTSKPLMTQSIYIESNLRANSKVSIRSAERTPTVVQSAEDGGHSIYDDEQLTAADASETDDDSKNKFYYERKPPSSSLVYNNYKTSLKSENRRNKEIRESIEGEENNLENKLERGEQQRRLSSGKRVVSFQKSTSGDYSMSRSSCGDLLIVVDGKIFRHAKEEEVEDTVSAKTLLKSQTPAPHHEKSSLQYKHAVNSSSQMSSSSKRGDPGRLLITSDGSVYTERSRQTQEPHGQPRGQPRDQPRDQPLGQSFRQSLGQSLGQPLGQPLGQQRGQPRCQPEVPESKTQTIQFEDWSRDVGQVEFSKKERRAREKSQLDLDAECRDTKSRPPHRTASSICGCKESYKDGCESVHKDGCESFHKGGCESVHKDGCENVHKDGCESVQEVVEYIPNPSGVNVLSKCTSSSERNDSQKPSHTLMQKFGKYRSSKRKESKEIRAREKSQLDLDAECRDAKSRPPHRTASSICGCKESYKDGCESVHKDGCESVYKDGCESVYKDGCEGVYKDGCESVYKDGCEGVHKDGCESVYKDGCESFHKDGCESVHKCSSIKLEKPDDCKCDDSFQRWCLGVGRSESKATAPCVGGSSRTSKAGRNLLRSAFSRRKGCECDCEQRDKHKVSVNEHCNELRPFGSIPRSAALAGKKCCHSLSRGSSCCSNDSQSGCYAGFPHSKPSDDCLDIIGSSPEVDACKELMLKGFKASGGSRRRRGRSIPPACSRFQPDVELPTPEDEAAKVRSFLVDKKNRPNLAMIGEIAGQLESRIVDYVFAGLDRQSSYGIAVRNIPEMIEIHIVDRETRKVNNVPLQFRLVKRFAFIKTSLKPFGYDFDFHPQFSIDMVNKYGRPNLSEVQRKSELPPIDPNVRKEFTFFIQTNCSPNETEHVTILLNCLMLLASDDGKSLFLWKPEK